MSIIHPLLQKLQNDVQELQKGLQPDHLSFWYQKIISDTKEMAPPWLQDKINVKQDPILPMKFNLDISKRAVRYFIIAVENNLSQMPYSTQLYFLKVQEIKLSGIRHLRQIIFNCNNKVSNCSFGNIKIEFHW